MKKQETKEQEVTQVSETKDQNFKEYNYAHLVLYCGKCRSKYIIDENIKKGTAVKIILPPTNSAEMRLVCKDCKNEMALFYIESNKKDEITENNNTSTKPIEEVNKQEETTDESISEEGITEATIV
jgi:uncharacterized protein YbaR (Trm112 family)